MKTEAIIGFDKLTDDVQHSVLRGVGLSSDTDNASILGSVLSMPWEVNLKCGKKSEAKIEIKTCCCWFKHVRLEVIEMWRNRNNKESRVKWAQNWATQPVMSSSCKYLWGRMLWAQATTDSGIERAQIATSSRMSSKLGCFTCYELKLRLTVGWNELKLEVTLG